MVHEDNTLLTNLIPLSAASPLVSENQVRARLTTPKVLLPVTLT